MKIKDGDTMRKFMILFAALWFVLFTLPVLTLDNAAEYTYPPPAENLAEPVSAPESEPRRTVRRRFHCSTIRERLLSLSWTSI